jgi:hypothetical protein
MARQPRDAHVRFDYSVRSQGDVGGVRMIASKVITKLLG